MALTADRACLAATAGCDPLLQPAATRAATSRSTRGSSRRAARGRCGRTGDCDKGAPADGVTARAWDRVMICRARADPAQDPPRAEPCPSTARHRPRARRAWGRGRRRCWPGQRLPAAEDRGFEPLRAVNPTRFPSERHRPLGESSAGEATWPDSPRRNRPRRLRANPPCGGTSPNPPGPEGSKGKWALPGARGAFACRPRPGSCLVAHDVSCGERQSSPRMGNRPPGGVGVRPCDRRAGRGRRPRSWSAAARRASPRCGG